MQKFSFAGRYIVLLSDDNGTFKVESFFNEFYPPLVVYEGTNIYEAWKVVMDHTGYETILPKELEQYL